jgi:hypothetical protein
VTVNPPEPPGQSDSPKRGIQSVTGDTFSFSAAVGGVRGIIEAVLPATVFIVVYVATSNLPWALIGSLAAALIAVVARLMQRTPITQALGGLLGIGVGVIWAWRSGEAQNFFAWGLWTNAIYLVAVLVSILVRWPAVGIVVELLRVGFGERVKSVGAAQPVEQPPSGEGQDPEPAADGVNPFKGMSGWRRDKSLLRRYDAATWLWVGMFAVRLAVQLPLYLDESIGWLGTARLVLGVPLWGLVLWLTWMVVRGAHRRA